MNSTTPYLVSDIGKAFQYGDVGKFSKIILFCAYPVH